MSFLEQRDCPTWWSEFIQSNWQLGSRRRNERLAKELNLKKKSSRVKFSHDEKIDADCNFLFFGKMLHWGQTSILYEFPTYYTSTRNR